MQQEDLHPRQRQCLKSLSYHSNWWATQNLEISGIFCFLFFLLVQFVCQTNLLALFLFFVFLILIYAILAFGTLMLLWQEREKLQFKQSFFWSVVWYHPLFLFSYVYVFLLSLFQKNVSWDKIEHHS